MKKSTVADTPGKNFCQIMRCILLITITINTHLLYKQPELSTAPSCRNWKWSLESYVSRKLIVAFVRGYYIVICLTWRHNGARYGRWR